VPALHRHDASASQARWPRGRHYARRAR
jgi:hypothetical protein